MAHRAAALAAVLLLVAIIAAIALTLRQRKDTKHTDASEQIKAKKSDRVRLVKMQPTVEGADATPAAAKASGESS
jgi:NADH-quinone oxidoreductase subunit J